jgi:alkanesulfonate monooxygenase SsuD/methylene tetrahydromethanopterin reductase-like flavin-dependent oxidoreductase (luciferase family)
MLPSADLFICRAAALTKRIRLGPAIRPLPYYNPIQVAAQAATCDHLTNGRYMAGFGGARANPAPGARDYFRQFGIDAAGKDKRAMMFEALDLILECWSHAEPFDFHGQFWNCVGVRIQPKPLQQPRMPVGIANSESPETARIAGEKGLLPLHFYYDTAPQLRELGDAFVEGARSSGRVPSRKDIHVVRFVHVSDSVQRAKDEVREATTENILRMKQGMPLQHVIRSLPPGGTVDDITFDYLVDSGIFFVGDPDTVYRRVMDFYEEMGGFGALVFAVGNASLGSREQRQRSWRLFMEEVAPRLAQLDPDRVPVATA